MGSSYGRQVLDQVGASIQVSADANPVCKVGGVTVDWSVVVAVSADTYLEDGFFCPNGEKYLRYGQVLTRENPLNTQTVTITGSPTGGTFTLTVVNPLTSVSMTTAPLAWNATGTDVMNALAALGNIGQGNVFGSGPATGPYGVTFQGIFVGSTVATMTASTSFTGGSSPGITVTAAAPTATPGNWGPYDPNATDGRATLSREDTYILNASVREMDFHSNHPAVIQGGMMWKDRILANTVAASLVSGPLWSALLPVIPGAFLVKS